MRTRRDRFKTLTTRWDKRWRTKDGEWKMKVGFVGREYIWAEDREDFSPGATHSAPEYLERLAKAGRDTDIVWRLR